jgi:uncharacterized protein (DUF2336 family)
MQPESLIHRLQSIVDRLGPDRTADRREAVEHLAEFVAAIAADGPATRFQILAVELVRAIIREIEVPLRRLIAERLAHEPGVAPSVVRILANDDIDVAWPILAQSQALGEADLIAIASASTAGHRTAIAGRADVSLAISQCLASFGEREVVNTLVANDRARISREAFAIIADLARGWPELQAPLSQREDLPAVVAYEMLGWVAEALHGFLFRRLSIDADSLRKVIAEAADDAAARMAEDGHAFALLDGMLGSWGTWEEDRLIGFLQLAKAGRVDLFEVALAQYCDEPLRLVRKACRTADFGELAVMCRAREIGDITFAAILETLAAGRDGAETAIAEGMRAFETVSVGQARAIRSMRPDY